MNNMTNKEKIDSWLLIGVFFIILFQQIFLNYCNNALLSKCINYFDDIIACILVILLVFKIIKKWEKLLIEEKIILPLTFVFLAIGLVSSAAHPMQKWYVVVVDALSCCKFIVFYYAIRMFENSRKSRYIIDNIAHLSKVFIVLFFVLAIHDIVFSPFFTKVDTRIVAGIRTLNLCFPFPTCLAAAMLTMSGVIVLCASEKDSWRNGIWLILSLVPTVLTWRSKALGGVAVFVLLYCVFVIFKVKPSKKINYLTLILGVAGIVVLGSQKIDGYYISGIANNAPRAKLTLDSIKIANGYFPLGSGFATFASNSSVTYFSPMYEKLGYFETYDDNGLWINFLKDTFWPIVVAQNGWIGLVVFIAILICFISIIFKMQKINISAFCSSAALFIYLIIDTLGETSFFNPMHLMMIVIIAIGVNLSHCIE